MCGNASKNVLVYKFTYAKKITLNSWYALIKIMFRKFYFYEKVSKHR